MHVNIQFYKVLMLSSTPTQDQALKSPGKDFLYVSQINVTLSLFGHVDCFLFSCLGPWDPILVYFNSKTAFLHAYSGKYWLQVGYTA